MTAPAISKTPSFRLDGRRALVSGAGRGIGAAVAAALAEAGAHVTLCARTTSEIEQGATALRAAGLAADWLTLDVTDLPAFAEAMAAAEPYSIFVNNAGTNRPNPFTAVPVEDFDHVMGLNVRAAFFAAQAVARRMIAAGGPGVDHQHVVADGPCRWRQPFVVLRLEMGDGRIFQGHGVPHLAPHGIRVNTLAPTFIETLMTKLFFENAAFRESVLSKIKLGRLGTVEDLMGAVVFLASDASALMTGSSLVVDGGWTAD